jgi:energy-coupling factor transporter ATP-binding protein EcfA2
MIFLRGYILGFGKLSNRNFHFKEGLNVIFAPNEGGKSTLQRFLVGLLYGQLRSDLKVQRRPDPWAEQYKPWHGSEYGGILWCRLADGREMELHRNFGREETRIEIRTLAGEDITRQYEQQRNGEVLFAFSHLGIPKGLFESVGVIRENKVAEIQGYETIRDRIANLAQSGNEDLSIRQSLASIQAKLDEIGSDRAPTKPYKQTLDLVQALRDEQKAVDERRAQFRDWIEERNQFAGEISRLDRELLKTRSALLSARRWDVSARIQSLEEIEKERGSLRLEMDSLGSREDFPAHRLEELNQLVGARDSIEKHRNEVRLDKETAEEKLSQAERERKELESYGAFSASAEAEKITEWFVQYLSLSLQKDGLQKTMTRLRGEKCALEEHQNSLSPALTDSKTDWQRMAREAVEDEQSASQNSALVKAKIVQGKTDIASAARMAFNRQLLSGAILILGAMALGAWFFAGSNRFSSVHLIGFEIGFLAAAGLLMHSALKWKKTGRNVKQLQVELEQELSAILAEGRKKRRIFNAGMTGAGFQEVEDFLAAVKQSEQNQQKSIDIQSRLAESEQQLGRLQMQSDEIYQLLKDNFAKVNLSCSPGNLKFQIDLFRSNLRQFRDREAHCGNCRQEVSSLTLEDANLTEEYNIKNSIIQSLLDQAQVGSSEQFREECLKQSKLFELRDKEASRTREFQRLSGDLTLPQWKEKLQELMEQPMPLLVEPHNDSSENSAPCLPYLPTLAETEEQEREIVFRLSNAREGHARAMERVQHAFQGLRSSAEIDEDLAVAEQSLQELETNRTALGIALETLDELSRQQQEVLAPQLNAAVEQRFLRLCNGRYEEVKIDPDFQVWAREADTGELRLAEHLSRGTQDQIYFAMRFGILDLVSKAEEPCPSLLDEPFAAYDRTRLGEAFEVLKAESDRRQLFLFTCREDLLELAQQSQAHIIRLNDVNSRL